ncbi:MAG: DNA helicase-2/ATP-dependent DNA helicase PcrA [Colwellia sp.]|jgi:DNA helicase-2/ATP-dependent DNA helicase PcrA
MMNISKEKQAIIKIKNQHIKVESGPGAGKSTLLVEFIKERLSEGVDESRILVLMFTNASKEKFSEQLKNNKIIVKTLHSYGYELFSQLTSTQSIKRLHVGSINNFYLQRFYRQALTEANSQFANSKYHRITQQTIENFYTFVTLKRNVDFKIEGISQFAALDRLSNQVFETAYEKIRNQINDVEIIPINEVLAIPAEVFAKKSNESNRLKEKYDYILIDEAQDLSEIDYAMIHNHLGLSTKVIMVGDIDQSINEFRGANSNIFKSLHLILNGVFSTKLKGSYRFSKGLSSLAYKLFEHKNEESQIFSRENTYASIEIERFFDIRHPLISALKKEDQLKDNCLILREKNAFPLYELMLLDNDIPYSLRKNSSFVFHKPISMLLGYFLLANKQCISFLPLDIQNAIVKGMLYTPYPQAQPEIAQWLTGNIPSIAFEIITTLKSSTTENNALGNIPIVSEMIRSSFTPQSTVYSVLEAMSSYKCFAPLISSNTAILNQSGLSQVRLLDYFKSTQMTIERLFSLVIKSFNNKVYKIDTLQLLTMHEVKGSEFKNVFIGALYDGIMPLIRKEEDKSRSSLEAEKRLLYVAMTRAIKKLTLLCPVDNVTKTNNNYDFNSTYKPYKTSRFLSLLI